MTLAAKFRSAADKAFKLAGDAVRTVKYTHVVPGAYDPATGLTVDVTTNHPVRALLVGLSDAEMDWFAGDSKVQKAIVPYVDMTFEPTSQSYFTVLPEGMAPTSQNFTDFGVRWEIKRIKTPPTSAVRTFYIREP